MARLAATLVTLVWVMEARAWAGVSLQGIIHPEMRYARDIQPIQSNPSDGEQKTWQRKTIESLSVLQIITSTKSGTGSRVIKISLGRLCQVKLIKRLRSQQQQLRHRSLQQQQRPC